MVVVTSDDRPQAACSNGTRPPTGKTGWSYPGMVSWRSWRNTRANRFTRSYSCGRCGKVLRSPQAVYKHLDAKHAK